MLVNFFKRQHNTSGVLVFLVASLLWVPSFFYPLKPDFRVEPLSELLNYVCLYNVTILKIVGFVMLYTTSILINRLVNKHMLCNVKTNLPGLIYVLLLSAFVENLYANPILVCNLIMLIIFIKLFDFDNKQVNTISRLYDLGLLIALSSMMYLPSVYFLVLVFIISVMIGSFNLKDLFSLVLGFVTIYLFYFSWFYFKDDLQNTFILKLWYKYAYGNYKYQFNFIEVGYIATIIVLGCLSIYTYSFKINSMLSRSRRISWILVITTILPSIYYAFSISWSIDFWILVAVPLSVFFSTVLLGFKKGYVAEIILYTIIALIIFGHLINYSGFIGLFQ